MPPKKAEKGKGGSGGSFFTNFGNTNYYGSESSDEDNDEPSKQRPAKEEVDEPSKQRPSSNPPSAVVPHSHVEVHSYYPSYDSWYPPRKPPHGYPQLGWGGYPPSDGAPAPPKPKPKPKPYHDDEYQVVDAGGYRRPPPAAYRPPQQPYAYGHGYPPQLDEGGYEYGHGGYHMQGYYPGSSPPPQHGGYGGSHGHGGPHMAMGWVAAGSAAAGAAAYGVYHRFHGHHGHGGYGHGYYAHHAHQGGKFSKHAGQGKFSAKPSVTVLET